MCCKAPSSAVPVALQRRTSRSWFVPSKVSLLLVELRVSIAHFNHIIMLRSLPGILLSVVFGHASYAHAAVMTCDCL